MQKIVLVCFLILSNNFVFAKSTTNMAEELVKLRAEVETLHNDLESLRTDKKSRVQSMHMRINDLEAQIQREEVAVAKSQEKLSQIEKEKASKQTSGSELIPVVQASLKATETSIMAGAPFRQTERVQSVKDIEKTLASSPVKALMQTWALVEDELRLHKEVGIYKQVIELDNNQLLVEIAKLGMTTIYFKTADDQYGYVKVDDKKSYQYTLSQNLDEQKSITRVFEAFKQNARQGFFHLPTASVIQGGVAL